jgi:hypothetical protein
MRVQVSTHFWLSLQAAANRTGRGQDGTEGGRAGRATLDGAINSATLVQFGRQASYRG